MTSEIFFMYLESRIHGDVGFNLVGIAMQSPAIDIE